MIKFSSLLNESIPIGKSIKAWNTLSYDAKDAINKWESMNWAGGPLEKAFATNSTLAQEIENAFAPVRATLPQKVKLYRGLWVKGHYANQDHSGRVLESWTEQPKVAEHFAGRRNEWFKPIIKNELTDKEIDELVARYNRTGFVKWNRYRLMRSRTNPNYFNIWFDNELQTDGDHDRVREFFTSELEWQKKWNTDVLSRGKIIEEMIDRNAVVWLTHNLKSAEYIVKVKR